MKNVNKYIDEKRPYFKKTKGTQPISTEYRPELDEAEVLEPVRSSYYQSLIGILRWAVELGKSQYLD